MVGISGQSDQDETKWGGSTPDGVAGSTSGRVYAVLFDKAGREEKKKKTEAVLSSRSSRGGRRKGDEVRASEGRKMCFFFRRLLTTYCTSGNFFTTRPLSFDSPPSPPQGYSETRRGPNRKDRRGMAFPLQTSPSDVGLEMWEWRLAVCENPRLY